MWEKEIFKIKTEKDFEHLALEIFHYQYKNVEVYRRFCDLLKTDISEVKSIENIPFLPIQFFKSHKIIAREKGEAAVFTSSGTTGSTPSKHFVADLNLYETSFLKAFEKQYGHPSNFCILALLPSYLEREGSSLIYMVENLIEKSNHPDSGFYLSEMDTLAEKLQLLEESGQKTILIGVSFALLDLVEKRKFHLKNTIVMETGGMKGRRKEMIKEELHQLLKKGFGVEEIHSEYGMTELLSQSYSSGHGLFTCPPWMKVLMRDDADALSYVPNKSGGINVIDLANLYSCAFIATQDLGKMKGENTFEVLGRFDASDVRGCNLMVI